MDGLSRAVLLLQLTQFSLLHGLHIALSNTGFAVKDVNVIELTLTLAVKFQLFLLTTHPLFTLTLLPLGLALTLLILPFVVLFTDMLLP